MRVRVERHGGFAGIPRTWTTDGVRDALVEACPWSVAPQVGPVDGFSYRITAGERAVTLTESQVKGPWRVLVDHVIAHDDGAQTQK